MGSGVPLERVNVAGDADTPLEAMSRRQLEAELAWWRQSVATRLDPAACAVFRVGRPTLGHRLTLAIVDEPHEGTG